MKKVAVVGADGKMGQEILKILSDQKFIPVPFTEKNTLQDEDFKDLDIVIEFSSPQGFENTIQLCTKHKCPLVSGTTGFSETQKKLLNQASRKIPMLWSANMSIGIAILKKAMELYSRLEEFDYQVEEFHHNQKKDRPSGTAIALQERLQKKLSKGQLQRLADPISVRAGGIIGIHKIYAISGTESLCFEHQALSRKVFAEGAIRAAKWLVKQKAGLYTIEDMLNL